MNAAQLLAAVIATAGALSARADTVPFDLSSGNLTQNWTNAALLTTNDDWSGVPGITGFRGDGLAAATGVDPQTILAADDPGVVDVNVNQTNPNTFTTGGVTEFAVTNPTVALTGSGTARGPHLRIYLDTSGREDVTISYTLRDLETGADNSVQQVALHYRIGSSGAWTNVPAAYVADASAGPNVAGPDIPISVTLPAEVADRPEVQLRIMTSDAPGADEWIGIDDIVVSSLPMKGPPPVLSVMPVSLAEGNAGITNFNFVFMLDAVASEDCVFGVETFGGDATPGVDYVAIVGMNVTIPAGQQQTTVTVQVNGDTEVEPDETFGLDVFGESFACDIFGADTTGTILNDDAANIDVSIAAASVTEGNGGTVNLNLPVTLSAPATSDISIPFTVTAGTATAGTDYQTTSGAVQIATGSSAGVATVVVNGDLLDEPDETLTVTLGMPPQGYTIVTGSAVGTILDDDAPPTISVSAPSVTEGNTGTTPMTFVVSLSAPSGFDVGYTRATANGSATAGSDYVALAAAAMTIPAGQTTQNVIVQVNGDFAVEPDETVLLNLTAVTNATPASASGTGTILNDDAVIDVSVAAASISEGGANRGSPTVVLSLPVSLSAATPQQVSIPFTVAAGTATAGVDYLTTSGNVVIAAGSQAGSIDVVIVDDALDENDETLIVTLGAPPQGYAIVNGSATGTIIDNDAAPVISVNSPSVNEGNAGTTALTFTVSLATPSGLPVSFSRATANGSATAGVDYVALAAAPVTIAAGQTSADIVVQVNGDFSVEQDETVILNVTGVSNATPTSLSGTGTIVNDDSPQPPPLLIPASDPRGLALLAVLLGVLSTIALRRRG